MESTEKEEIQPPTVSRLDIIPEPLPHLNHGYKSNSMLARLPLDSELTEAEDSKKNLKRASAGVGGGGVATPIGNNS